MKELLRGLEPEPPCLEVMIFMGICKSAVEGNMALRDYIHMTKVECMPDEEALGRILQNASFISGPIADLKDLL